MFLQPVEIHQWSKPVDNNHDAVIITFFVS